MFRFGSFFSDSVYSLMLKILGLVYIRVYRSKSSLAEEMGSSFSENRSEVDDDETSESSVLMQSGLVSKSSKCQFISGKDLSGLLEEPKAVEFVVHELFVGSDNVISSGQTRSSETCDKNDLFEKDLEENEEGFDQEPEFSQFYFKLLNESFYTTISEEILENLPDMENISGEGKEEKTEFCDFVVEGKNGVEDDGCAHEVELIPSSHSSSLAADEESDANGDGGILIIPQDIIEKQDSDFWMSSFLDQTDQPKTDHLEDRSLNNSCEEDLDEEYIEFEPQDSPSSSSSSSSADTDMSEESRGEKAKPATAQDSSKEGQNCWDSDSDCDEDEPDVLSEHQHLVQQMKMELKNCRIRGLPTISEESETPKMIEDLMPLQIDRKIGYKDVMEEIHKFYKSYSEKMRKLDILNFQTSHAISFLLLKESRAGSKKVDPSTFALSKIRPGKMRRVYADPMYKPITDMCRDLELVYVGQMCLSWEILCWIDVRARELLECDDEGNHSYNRAAEEFQQFQVLLQRFMEDEQFQGIRDENYVRSRCMIRSLLQVPTIKDDSVKTKKERMDETDAITLEKLVEIIKESMLIFYEFVLADKKATSVGLTKVDLQESGCSELLIDVVSSLQKKERRIREQIRSQNCIVKKLKNHQERRWEREILTSQVELRLVWRVLNMSRLSEDRLVWCYKKLNSIRLVGRKVEREATFFLFPF